jgi:hypothetical protein
VGTAAGAPVMAEAPTPRDPEWMVTSRITRTVERHLGGPWGAPHARLASCALNLWRAGTLHQCDLAAWIEGRYKLPT